MIDLRQLPCRAWAENLDAARDEIIARWGETLYRRFRLYLWGSAQAFLSGGAEAFRVVLERPLDGLPQCAAAESNPLTDKE